MTFCFSSHVHPFTRLKQVIICSGETGNQINNVSTNQNAAAFSNCPQINLSIFTARGKDTT